jgi:hypothetical protein
VSKIFTQYLAQDSSWEGVLKVDWYGLGGALLYVLAGIRPVAEDRASANSHDAAEFIYKALQSQQLLKRVPSEDAKTALAKIRDQVAEGLLLVDGLMQADRAKRISFDKGFVSSEKLVRTKNSLRSSSKALMSALELDSSSAAATSKGDASCAAFIAESPKESETLSKLPVGDKDALPSFIQDICKF